MGEDSGMNRIEPDLKDALRRQEPGPDFVGAVLERIDSDHARPARRFRWLASLSWSGTRWAAALVVCLMLSFSVVEYRRKQEKTRQQGELAKAQVMLALRITSAKLKQVQKIVLDRQRRADR